MNKKLRVGQIAVITVDVCGNAVGDIVKIHEYLGLSTTKKDNVHKYIVIATNTSDRYHEKDLKPATKAEKSLRLKGITNIKG